MRELAERAYFELCSVLGRLIRAARYSEVRIESEGGELWVRKRRRFYAPLLVGMARPLATTLDTGVRVLPRRAWEEQERRLYLSLCGAAVWTGRGGELVLPRLSGETLATLLEDRALSEAARNAAMQLAARALAAFHRRGFTHGDAMAENVLIDRDAGAAQWFDFETVHDPSRPIEWRRADDVRALVGTSLLRAAPEQVAGALRLILDAYSDIEVTRRLAATFSSAWQRPLAFHLAQADLSFHRFREIGRLLDERLQSMEL